MAEVKQDLVDVARVIIAVKAYAENLRRSAAKQKIPLAKQAIEKEASDYDAIALKLRA